MQAIRFSTLTHTRIVASVHASVMVTHGVQVVQDICCSSAALGLLFGARWQPGACASLDHVPAHIETREGEVDLRGELVALLSHLPEAFEMEDEDVGERPETQLHHALLELLTMRALPCVVWGQLSKHESRQVMSYKDCHLLNKYNPLKHKFIFRI